MNTEDYNIFLNEISEKSLPVIDVEISFNKYIGINFSESNNDLMNFNTSSS